MVGCGVRARAMLLFLSLEVVPSVSELAIEKSLDLVFYVSPAADMVSICTENIRITNSFYMFVSSSL